MVSYADTFDRANTSASAGLGSTSTGSRPWIRVQGTSHISGNRAVYDSASPAPIDVLELPGGDADSSCVGSGGAALYSRVVDANNWVRARVDYSSYTTSTPYTYYSYTYSYAAEIYDSSGNGYGTATCSTSSSGGCTSASEYGYSGSMSIRNRRQTSSSSQEHTGYSNSTTYSYVAVLEVCVNGTVTEVARTSSAGSMGRLRMKLAGNSAQIFYGGATTVAQLPAAAAGLGSAVRHGIGLGPSSTQEGYVDDYAVEVLNTAPGAPTSTAPAAAAVVAGGQSIRHAWTFTDPDAGDKQTAFELQYRVAGTTAWTTVAETSELLYWDAAAGVMSGTIEWTVRVRDVGGSWSPRSQISTYSVGSGTPGGASGGTGGGGGLGLTPGTLIALVQIAELRKRVDQITGG